MGLRRSSTASFLSRLVETAKVSTMKILLALKRNITAELDRYVSDTELRGTSVKSRLLTARI